MKRLLIGLIALAGISFSSLINATPCNLGGVTPAADCANGDGGAASADKLNDGLFFGFDDWTKLDKVEPGDPVDTTYWSGDFTGLDGDFSLVANIWNDHEDLVAVLKDGATGPNNDRSIKWSAYLLEDGVLDYDWNYDGSYHEISNIILFGRGGVGVPEPATLVLMGIALAGLSFARGRRV